MNLFALSDEVAALDAELSACKGAARLPLLVLLAWYARQSDCARALAYAEEAEALLPHIEIDDVESSRFAARLLLVRAEVKWLFADLNAAENLTNAAIAAFERLGDQIGIGDGFWLATSIWVERGNRQQSDDCLQATVNAYRAASDPLRLYAAMARALNYAAVHDANASAASLAQLCDGTIPSHLLVKTWIATAHATSAALLGQYGSAITSYLEAYHAAQDSGQLRAALIAAANAARFFSILGDQEAALEWNERALALARTSGWPGMVGICLIQTSDTLQKLERFDMAQTLLQEAIEVMSPLASSRNYAMGLQSLGVLALATHDHAAGLHWFQLLEDRARGMGQWDLLIMAKRGQATAFSRLGQPDDAIRQATTALTLAREHAIVADEQIKALRGLAEIHRQHAVAPPEGMTAPNATLHYLHQALALAATIKDYAVPAELLDEMASAYADCGDYRHAYETGLTAAAERSKARAMDAQNRAIAMQVRHETERAHAEAEHQRQRAEVLQHTNATLETLGQIGREITANLNVQSVCATLNRHVHQLLDASTFFVSLLDPTGTALTGVFAIEEGDPIVLPVFALNDPCSYSARCARERREIVIAQTIESAAPTLIPGTRHTQSMLFAPLLIGDRLLGVMSIQSFTAQTYGERECSIFRSLCAYSAIALDNASAYAAAEAARQETARALAQIDALNRQLHSENLRMSAELHVAQQLQRMVLPSREELRNIEGLEIAGFMQPADEVGGDYYDVLSSDATATIGIGDVTGHGLESGVLMIMTQTAIRTLLEHGETDPVKFLNTLNRTMYKNTRRMAVDRSLTLALVHYAHGQLTIAGQHEDLIVVRRGGVIELVDTIDLGFPIGLEYDISAFIAKKTIALHPGDGVVLYTDGVTEAENSTGDQYGLPRLCDAVSRHWDASSEQIQQAVIHDIQAFIGAQKTFDDLTLVVFKQQ